MLVSDHLFVTVMYTTMQQSLLRHCDLITLFVLIEALKHDFQLAFLFDQVLCRNFLILYILLFMCHNF